jgi:hypothetical protein
LLGAGRADEIGQEVRLVIGEVDLELDESSRGLSVV